MNDRPRDHPHRDGDAVRRRPEPSTTTASPRLAEFLLANGSDGLVVAGTTGESPTLSDDEKLAMFRTVVARRGRPRARRRRHRLQRHRATASSSRSAAEACGVDAVLVVTPYYNKPPERGLLAHFRAVAAATSLPVIVYNIPGRCVVNLSPEALAELGEVENIVAVKQANPDLAETRPAAASSATSASTPATTTCCSTCWRWAAPAASAWPATSSGRGWPRSPGSCRAGDLEAGPRPIDAALHALYKALFVTANPIPVKAALNLLGHEVGGLRLPLVPADTRRDAVVAAELRRLGLTGV